MQTKTCSNCKVEKAIAEFEASRWYKDGFRGQCRPCRYEKAKFYKRPPKTDQKRDGTHSQRMASDPEYRRRFARNVRLKHKFGITVEQFDQMSAFQDHKCALCFFPAAKMAHGVLEVDHCHTTGKVRGLLCTRCNTMLGRVGDDVAGANRIVEYVTKGASSLYAAGLGPPV